MSKIKLIDIIKELNVNNSRITPELVTDYWENKIYLNKDYGRLRDKYLIKLNLGYMGTEHLIEKLSYPDLVEFYKDLKQLYNKQQEINELQINPSIQWRPFRNNNFEKGKTVKETIINFIKANPYQPEIIITTNIGLRRWYHPKVVLDNLRDTLNMGVVRKQVINPTTKRKVWIYYLSQDKLFELNINPNRITRGDIYSILINSNVSNNFMNNVGIINKYAETQYWESWMEGLNKIEDKDLNKCYNELKQINGD